MKKLVSLILLLSLSLTACEKQNQKNVGADETALQNRESKPLKVGVLFSQADALDPTSVTSPGGILLMFCLYDSLATVERTGVKLRMAQSIEANENFTEYKITLKKGLKHSDGSEVTGQEALDSLRYIGTSPMYQSVYGNADFEKSKAEGATVYLVLKKPASDFVESCLGMFSPVGKGGKFEGVGPGGFVLEKGDAQTGYSLKANELYYAGKPSIPEITLLNIPDSASKIKALQTGEIDYAWGLDATAIKILAMNKDIELPQGSLDSATAFELVLNTRVPPFNDPEVRKAAKLTVDRDRLVSTLLGDYGEVGNDMLGKGYKTYPEDIAQTKVNKEEAKKIFSAKGIREFTIISSDIMPGLNNAVKLMAEDFADVGVKVNVEELDPQTFFAQMGQLYQSSAFSFYWINRLAITEFRSQVLKASPYNVSGYWSDAIEKNYTQLTSTKDEKLQADLVREISKEVHDDGGDLIWGYQKDITARRKGLKMGTTQSVLWLPTARFIPEN